MTTDLERLIQRVAAQDARIRELADQVALYQRQFADRRRVSEEHCRRIENERRKPCRSVVVLIVK